MSNGDESMSPAEFAKLMGAYPEPTGNPSPAYGGFMDNSAANFAWVNNNDYFGADSGFIGTDIQTQIRNKIACPHCGEVGEDSDGLYMVGRVQCNNCNETFYADTDLTPTNHINNSIGQVVPITNPMELPTNLIEVEAGSGPEGQITPDVFSAEYIMVKCDSCGKEKEKDSSHSLSKNEAFPSHRPVKGFRYCSRCDEHICDSCRTDGHKHFDRTGCESHDMISGRLARKWKKEIAERKAKKNAETFEATPKWECDACGDMHDDEDEAESCCVIDCDHSDSEMSSWGGAYRGSEFWMICNNCGAEGYGSFGSIDWSHDDKTLEHEQTAETFEAKQDTDSWKTGVIRLAIDSGCFTDDYAQFVAKEIGHDSKRFNAPYGGTGAIMDIGKSTPLENFTDEELTTSSAIHGDFDTASIDYSGHQNIEVRAEMDIVADGMAVVSNIRDEVVGAVEVIDDEDDDEMVEISIQDENLEEIGSFTLDDGEIFGDEDDYNSNFGAEKKSNSILPIALGVVAAIFAYPYLKDGVTNVFGADNEVQEILENDPELIENPDIGDLDPAQYEELVVESTGYAVDIIPMGLDGSFMGSRFAALPTERYVDYNDPGIGAHTDIALNRDETFLEPEMAMVQAAEGETVVKETQAPGQSPYFQMGQEPLDMNYRVIKETHPVSLDPAVKSFIPQSMTGYTGNKNTPPSVYNKMFNIGVLGQTPLFTPQDAGDIGASRAGSRRAKPNILGLNGSVGGPLSDKVNANYTDGTTSMSLAQWAIENTVSQSSDTEAVVIDRSSGAMKRVRRV